MPSTLLEQIISAGCRLLNEQHECNDPTQPGRATDHRGQSPLASSHGACNGNDNRGFGQMNGGGRKTGHHQVPGAMDRWTLDVRTRPPLALQEQHRGRDSDK
jgi:hypothetical protein